MPHWHHKASGHAIADAEPWTFAAGHVHITHTWPRVRREHTFTHTPMYNRGPDSCRRNFHFRQGGSFPGSSCTLHRPQTGMSQQCNGRSSWQRVASLSLRFLASSVTWALLHGNTQQPIIRELSGMYARLLHALPSRRVTTGWLGMTFGTSHATRIPILVVTRGTNTTAF